MVSANDRPVSREVGQLVRDVALAVADGQRELDAHSLATQRELAAAAEAGETTYELDAPWYKFADVDVDLTLEMETTLHEESEGDFYRPRLLARPVSPRERAVRDVDAALTSDVRFRVVPVPPERE